MLILGWWFLFILIFLLYRLNLMTIIYFFLLALIHLKFELVIWFNLLFILRHLSVTTCAMNHVHVTELVENYVRVAITCAQVQLLVTTPAEVL